MPNNYSGVNVSTKTGEGGADVLSWGNLDRAANQVYQEQKIREQRGYNDYLQGQAALQKEFANVRSADIPEVVSEYNTLKRIRQQMLFDDKLKNDVVSYAKAQQIANIQEAKLRQLIGASQELKKTDEGINQRMLSHNDDFEEGSGEVFRQHMNMPLSERMKVGAIGVEPYLYRGGNFDFGKISRTASGTPTVYPLGEEVETPDKWQFEQKQIKRGNAPSVYAKFMYDGMQSNKAAQAARVRMNSYQPSDVQKIVADFNAIPDKEYEARWGQPKSQLTDGVLPDDKAGQYILLDAMNYATQNMPKDVPSKFRENKAYIDKMKDERAFDEWLKKNKITSEQAMDRARLYQQFQREKEDANLGAPEAYLEKSRTGNTYPGKLGADVEVIKLPEIVTNELKTSEGKKVKNVGLYQGRYFDIKTHDNGEIDWTQSKEIPFIQLKSAITNKALPSNFKVKQVTGNQNGKQKIAGF